jgi:hypothetical protein
MVGGRKVLQRQTNFGLDGDFRVAGNELAGDAGQ